MSLIYQALQQTAQRESTSRAAAVQVSRPPPALLAPTGLGNAGAKPLLATATVTVLVCVGLLGAFFVGRWLAPGAEALASAKPGADKTQGFNATQVTVPWYTGQQGVAAAPDLPLAEPLPTASPRLTLTYALPVAQRQQPGVVAPDVGASVESKLPVPAPSPTTVAEEEDLSERFTSMNEALENRDSVSARNHLRVIQSLLPANSVARLRAEGWYAYQSGDNAAAQRAYRNLLERLPADEHVAVTLASLEKKAQRLDQAREILSKSLKHNPGSSTLRAALDQLASVDNIK